MDTQNTREAGSPPQGAPTNFAGKKFDFERPEPIIGTEDADNLEGTEDKDVILAGEGNDTVDAGAGNDFVRAGAGDDVVSGGEGDDKIGGGEGDDDLSGGDGDDKLHGGQGNDDLTGGDGADSFFFAFSRPGQEPNSVGDDTIHDFSLEEGDLFKLFAPETITTTVTHGDSDDDGVDDYTVVSFSYEEESLGSVTILGNVLSEADLNIA